MYNKRFSLRPKYTPRRIFKRGYARPSISNYVRTKPETKVMDWTSSISFQAMANSKMIFGLTRSTSVELLDVTKAQASEREWVTRSS